MVRHLRNGIAHGNRFQLRRNEPGMSAHFTGPEKGLQSDGTTLLPRSPTNFFEITRELQGTQVLFGFIGPGDLCELFTYIGVRLLQIANSLPPKPLWPQRHGQAQPDQPRA